MSKDNPITIVIPVYSDWPSLKDCIESLQKHVNTNKHEVMVVNDCGPEADKLEELIKRSVHGLKGFKYYRNPKNLGFLKTCNRAVLELDKTQNDILLLNSDTKVTEGFLEELTGVLNSSEKIAVVTPRTNNATLATIPVSAAKQKGIDPGQSYKLFLKVKDKLPRYNEVPTAHGFCMLIKRTVIDKYGLFDEVFGKGYGEENDFSLRLKKEGYLSVLSNWSFVFHLEARSFTLEKKSKMLEKNLRIIHSRYPQYRKQVRDYFEFAEAQEASVLSTNQNAKRLKQSIKKIIKQTPWAYRTARVVRDSLKK